jgi:hypothetical protein
MLTTLLQHDGLLGILQQMLYLQPPPPLPPVAAAAPRACVASSSSSGTLWGASKAARRLDFSLLLLHLLY